MERLDLKIPFILETETIVHDIGIKVSEEEYGFWAAFCEGYVWIIGGGRIAVDFMLIKDKLYKFFYVFVFSIMLLYLWNPPFLFCCVVFDVLYLWVILKYGKWINYNFLSNIFLIAMAFWAAYFLEKLLHGSSYRQFTIGERVVVVFAILEQIIILIFIIIGKFQGKESKADDLELIKTRKYDLERLKEFVYNYILVGLNGTWGSGKTFLVQKLYEDEKFKATFDVIHVDLLMVQLEEIEKYLLNRMDEILESYSVFSETSKRLQDMIGNNHLVSAFKKILFQNDQIVSSVFQNYKQEIDEKLPRNKMILIVYEDIDRITDTAMIMKIFALSEKLSSKRIHVLYQFGYEYLENMELKKGNIEKYIPHVVTLSPLDYTEVVEHLWEECQMDKTEVKLDDVRFLMHIDFSNYRFDKIVSKKINTKPDFYGITIRTVKIFLEEMKLFIIENAFYQRKENQDILIKVLFVKHFLYPYFEKIEIGKDITESLLFQVKDEKITIQKLIQLIQTVEKEDIPKEIDFSESDFIDLFQLKENRDTYYILNMLGYDFFNQQTDKKDGIVTVTSNVLKRRQQNERINCIIWNVMGNGFSEYTNMEQAVSMLFENVLTEDRNKWQENWQMLAEKAFHGDLYKNNRGIFLFGVDQYLLFFQAMRVNMHVTQSQWRKWIEFYFDKVYQEGITLDMIECLKYCDFTKGKDLYLDTLSSFSNCEIKGNFTGNTTFLRFIHNFMVPIGYLGFSQRYCFEGWRFEFKNTEFDDDMVLFLKEVLNECIRVLDKEMEKALFPQFKEELITIKTFILKCNDIMDAPKTLKPRKLQSKITDTKTIYEHQEKLEELIAELKDIRESDKERFIFKLEQEYKANYINPSEYQVLSRQFYKKFQKSR